EKQALFQASMIELGVLAGLILTMVFAIFLLHRARDDGKPAGDLTCRDDDGFFDGVLSIRQRQPIRYHARNEGGDWWITVPYSFGPVLGPMDDYYIAEGSHLRL
ncbi:hypothetical protein, partial [Methylobacterium nigriterrae]|uniref:hypothetical protein n=1 Tax=Methylobacterium nigriterrae TaxID=3127512 RepID=UPI003D66E91E